MFFITLNMVDNEAFTFLMLLSLPVIWGILEEVFYIIKYGKEYSGVIDRSVVFRYGYAVVSSLLLIYLLIINQIIASIVVAIAWLISIRMEVIKKSKIKYYYDDSLRVLAIYAVIVIMLLILAMMI